MILCARNVGRNNQLIFILSILINNRKNFAVASVLPKIWLDSYIETDSGGIHLAAVDFPEKDAQFFENEFVRKNGTEYVISSDTQKAIFICEAEYPITWKLPDPSVGTSRIF